MDTISLSNTISKVDGREAMSLTYASLKDAAGRQEDSISTERLEKDHTILDTYTIVSDPIYGGMGSVWRVHHNGWNLDLAMKRPRPRFFAEGGPERKKGFLTECENWIRLGLHPNIVSCYYVREIGGVPSVFSEWMDGGSLKDRIRDGSLYDGTDEAVQERILDIAIQSARGLMYSHRNGLLHQDMKPGNLLLTQDWDAKVADFGLANAKTQIAGSDIPDAGKIELTGYTPEYCPREQAIGRTPARWMDVYAWALTVLEMYAGERLWEKGEEAEGECEEYFDRCCREVPAGMRQLIATCLTKKPNGFKGVLNRLEQIYTEVTGHKYPRKYPEKAASDTADSLNNRALSYLDLGMPQEAEELWEEALRHEPDHADTLFNRELYLLRTSRKTDTQTMAVLNNFGTTRAIGAADMIALECGGSYEAAGPEYYWECPQDEEIREMKICPETVYALTIAIYDRHVLTGLRMAPAEDCRGGGGAAPAGSAAAPEGSAVAPAGSAAVPAAEKPSDPKDEVLDPLDEIREKEYDLWPWSSELEKHIRPKKATRIEYMDIHPGKGLAAFMIFDTVCIYSLDERKIIGEAKTNDFTPRDAFGFNPEGTGLVLCGSADGPGHRTLLLEIPSMKAVLDERASFIGFLKGEKILLRGRLTGDSCDSLVEVAADGSYRVLFRFEEELKECHEFVAAGEPFLCYRYKESGETFRLDRKYSKDPMGDLLFDAAKKVCFYDPDQQLAYIDNDKVEVWDAQKGSFLFTSVDGFSNYRWEERRGAFLSFDRNRADLRWKWSPLPRRKADVRPAQWMVSHILTSKKRVSEDERIRAMFEEFERASGDAERCIKIYHKAREIDGFAFSEEADSMVRWLDENAERTGILGVLSLGVVDEIPKLSEEVFDICDCSHGLRAMVSPGKEGRVLFFDKGGELVREVSVPKSRAAVRGDRIYAFMEPMQWAAYDLWGQLVREPEAGWPSRWKRGKGDKVFCRFCDLDSGGKLALFAVYDEDDPAVGGIFLMEMASGKVRRLSDQKGHAAFLRDDSAILVSEKSIYRCDSASGNLIRKALQPPQDYVFKIHASQEKDRFYVQTINCILIYDMDCKLLGSCRTTNRDLHWLPGGRFIKDDDRIWNVEEGEVELVIRTPGVLKESEYRRIAVSPDGRMLYAEKYKAYERGEVIGYRLEYDYGIRRGALPGSSELSGVSGAPGSSLLPGMLGLSGISGALGSSLLPDLRDSGDPFAEENSALRESGDPFEVENSALRESRRKHASEDKKLEKFLKNPLKNPPLKEYKEPDRRRPAGSRPYINLAEWIVKYQDLDNKSRMLVKVRVNDIECLFDPVIGEVFSRVSNELGENGRVLTKRSGVIPEIMILIEADTDEICIKYMTQILDALWEEGFMEE